MGKPYGQEIQNLPQTYRFAANCQIDGLICTAKAMMEGPLVAVGSGGSLSAAHFAATLHQISSGKVAKAMTPLEANAFSLVGAEISFLLLSAGGGNPDILDAFKSLVVQEPRRLAVMTGRSGSKLSRLVTRYRYVDYLELQPPSGADGFLATNSLLAFCVAIGRAYATAGNFRKRLPKDFPRLIGGPQQVNAWRHACLPLWQKENLIVLFPPGLQAAALDLESKFTEAAIGNAQIADYRHFAHGRHHWLAKKGNSTGVLAFVTPSIRELADRTLSLLPSSVPITKLQFVDDPIESALAALSAAILITGFAGATRGIDPGRPGVPAFGRKIYHLRGRRREPAGRLTRQHAIVRKSGTVGKETYHSWDKHLGKFIERLAGARFRSAVFDYDGTLCDEKERFKGPSPEIIRNLVALVQADVPIGIATGRGKSAKRDLRSVLPAPFWGKVVVGYYNGYDVGLLSDDTLPSRTPAKPEWKALASELRDHPFLSVNAVCEVRAGQISITPAATVGLKTLWQVVAGIVKDRNLTVVLSSHAVDVTSQTVSKLTVLEMIRKLFGLTIAEPILCFGDRGNPPGNDALLLSHPYSLSVHEVSVDPNACWNLAPRGHRGVQAMNDYFKAFQLRKGHFRVAIRSMLK